MSHLLISIGSVKEENYKYVGIQNFQLCVFVKNSIRCDGTDWLDIIDTISFPCSILTEKSVSLFFVVAVSHKILT